MTDMLQQPFVQAFALALVHFLWQGAVLAAMGAVLMRMAKSPRARHAIGVCVLAAMCAAPLATAWYLNPSAGVADLRGGSAIAPVAGGTTSSVVGQSRMPGTLAASDTRARILGTVTPPVILGLWLSGVLALSVRLAGGWWMARGLARRSVHVASAEIQSVARRVAGRLALDRMVRIVESSTITVPVMVGWISPVVVLPTAALSGLSPAQVEALLAHELAHVFRHDYLVNLLQSVVETLLFYHPAVWWMSGQVRAAREQCCDDLAIGVCDRFVYATALAELAAMTTQPRLALAAADGSLVDRVRRILGKPESPRTLRAGIVPAALLFLTVAAMIPAAFEPAARAQSMSEAAAVRTGVEAGVQGGAESGVTAGVTRGVVGGVRTAVFSGVKGGIPGGQVAGVQHGVKGVQGGVDKPEIEVRAEVDPQDQGRLSQEEIRRILAELEHLQKQLAERLRQSGQSTDQVDDAKALLERMKTLQEKNVVSQQTVKDAEAKLMKAQVDHEMQVVDAQKKIADAVRKDAKLSDEQMAELKSRLADLAAGAASADVSKASIEGVRRALEQLQTDVQVSAQTGWIMKERPLSPEASALRDRLPRDGTLLSDEAVMSVIKDSTKLGDEGDRADVLIAIAQRQTLTPDMVSAFVSAVNGIKNDDQRARVFRTPVRLRANRGR